MEQLFKEYKSADAPAVLNYPERPNNALQVVRFIKEVDNRFLTPDAIKQFIDADFEKGGFIRQLQSVFTEAELRKHELWYLLNDEEPPKDGTVEFFDLPGDYSIENFYRRLDRNQRLVREIEEDRTFQREERAQFAGRLLEHFGEEALKGHKLWYLLWELPLPKDDMTITDEDLPDAYSIQDFMTHQRTWWENKHPRNQMLEI